MNSIFKISLLMEQGTFFYKLIDGIVKLWTFWQEFYPIPLLAQVWGKC